MISKLSFLFLTVFSPIVLCAQNNQSPCDSQLEEARFYMKGQIDGIQLKDSLYRAIIDGACTNETKVRASFELATFYSQYNLYEGAIKLIDKLDSTSCQPMLLGEIEYLKSTCYLKLGEFKNSIKAIDKAIEFFPSKETYSYTKGKAYFDYGEYSKCLEYLNTVHNKYYRVPILYMKCVSAYKSEEPELAQKFSDTLALFYKSLAHEFNSNIEEGFKIIQYTLDFRSDQKFDKVYVDNLIDFCFLDKRSFRPEVKELKMEFAKLCEDVQRKYVQPILKLE